MPASLVSISFPADVTGQTVYLTWLLAAPTASLFLFTLFSNWQGTRWWLRLCDFPRVQIFLTALTLILILQWLRPAGFGLLSALNLIVVVWQACQIIPYTSLWKKDVGKSHAEAATVSLLIANVLMTNRKAEGLLEQINTHQPDIILTLESDSWWQQQLDQALSEHWCWQQKIPLDNLYGMHLYARIPIEDIEVRYLIQEDIPSIHCWVRLESDHRIRLHAVHPRPPIPGESKDSIWRDAELMKLGKMIREEQAPTLVAGDLNDVAWSMTTRRFCRVAKMLDPRRGRGFFSTFHARWRLLRWPLDHVFVGAEFRLKKMQRLKAFGSDHFPILVQLSYEPGFTQPDEPTPASQAELQKAEALKQKGENQQQPESEK